MKKYGLIGYPLSHSFSPKYFSEKFQREGISAEYKAYPLSDLSSLPSLFEKGISGLNVTIPYKEKVIPFLDELDAEAEEIGAVNTIKNVDGKLFGYNTDIYGFRQSILALALPFRLDGSRALILGTGGASKAIFYVLSGLGLACDFATTQKVTKRNYFSYEELSNIHLSEYQLIVNTTPLGMHPNVAQKPDIPIWDLGSGQLVFDLTYNPPTTLLLHESKSLGCIIQNGKRMLELQAEKSWEIWNT